MPRLDNPGEYTRAGGGGRDPFRFAEALYPCRNYPLGSTAGSWIRSQRPRSRHASSGRERLHRAGWRRDAHQAQWLVMQTSQQDTLGVSEKEPGLRYYLSREPLILTLLTALAVLSFLGVSELSRIYHAQLQSLGNRWFTRGVADLKQRQFERAVSEFRTALLYSRDNYDYQLDLAEALVGMKRLNEAYAYLINLWEREPENGLVNLELARIAVQRGETERALRYYHNAIYAIWPGDQEVPGRNTRLELIRYLLSIDARTKAQSELIALAANLDDDPSMHA